MRGAASSHSLSLAWSFVVCNLLLISAIPLCRNLTFPQFFSQADVIEPAAPYRFYLQGGERKIEMWLVMLLGMILFLIGFVMWLCGADGVTILLTLTVIALACLYLFMGGCIYLVTILLAPEGSPWPLVTPLIFLAFVALVHWRALK